MNGYILFEAANADLQRILVGSVAQWGLVRAERYILELHEVFESLAAFPNLGRDAGHIRDRYFQLQHASHTVF